MNETNAFWEALDKGGVLAFFIIIFLGGLKETPVWVFGTHYRSMRTEKETQIAELRTDRDYWRNLAQEMLYTAREGVQLAERRHRVVGD